ncbi:metallophosphoesterase [Methanogenium sp. S4BF]|uniref:metallophosphoesterase n=1 Tax=Methanogenium sp. S4BF TaxID=1789226 RepID=UPI00241777ED|nr:metallophosphoesterase [Methanogenium sp. S4BF]WFN34226.1 metallophosphoesterase [Methanogenium sp. S4BF]
MKDRLKTYTPHLYATVFGLVLLTGMGGYMVYEGQSAEITVIEMEGAPNDIVFIADPHLKSGNLAFMHSVAEEINALNASLVLIGGDFVTSDEDDLTYQNVWAEIDAPVYAVLGNHDYKAGVHGLNGPAKMLAMQEADLSVDGYDVSMLQDDPLIDLAYGADVAAALEDAGVHVMQNEYELLSLGGTELMLVGVDDAWAGRADPPAVPETDVFTIYMIHEPGARADWDADLILSGHLHGGQFSAPGLELIKDAGIFDIQGFCTQGETPAFITRGIGSSSMIEQDLRFGTPPEIVVINPSVPIDGADVMRA